MRAGIAVKESSLRVVEVVVVEVSVSEGGGCTEILVGDDGPFEARWVHWRLGTRSGRDGECGKSRARDSWIHKEECVLD